MAFEEQQHSTFISVNYDIAKWVKKLAERDSDGNRKEQELGSILIANLTGIKVKTTEYNGNEMQKFYFHFQDGNERYTWSPSTSTSLAHNLINRLINRTQEELTEKLRISLKLAKSNKGNDMVNMWVETTSETPYLWQCKGDEVPAVVYEKVGKKEYKNDTERVDFYVAHAEEIDRVLQGAKADIDSDNAHQALVQRADEDPQENNKEGLPF